MDFENNEFLRDALSSGIELTSYIEKVNTDIKSVEDDTIKDSLTQLGNLNSLYNDLETTDNTEPN